MADARRFRVRSVVGSPRAGVATVRTMRTTPDWSPERLADWSLRRRRAILAHAVRHVPHYATAVGSPRMAATIPWEELPTLARDVIRDMPMALRATGRRAAGHARTSGSTGVPIEVVHDARVNVATVAVLLRHWMRGGSWRPGKRQIRVGASGPARLGFQRVSRIHELSAFHIDDHQAGVLVDVVARHHPPLLRGFPSALAALAARVEDRGDGVSFGHVVTHSEVLLPAQRRIIERVFGAPVLDHWCHWERAGSIGQCPTGSYHVDADYGFVEVLAEDGTPCAPGETGEIVVTGLHNLVMPLIRYRTGDQGAWAVEPCACGSPFPTIEQPQGRLDDAITTTDGRRIRRVAGAVAEGRGVLQCQIVQSRPDEVVVRVVPGPDHVPHTGAEAIAGALRRLLADAELRVRTELVPAIELTEGGKVRMVRSTLWTSSRSPQW